MVTIRQARPDEVKKLQDLNDAAFAANPDFDPDLILDWAQSATGKAYFTQLLVNPDSNCLVAEDGDNLVGYIAAAPKLIPHRHSRYIEIENIGVTPQYRNRGVGSLLIKNCLTWAKAQGYQKVYLNSYAKNTTALTFYEKLGLQPIAIELEKNL